MRAEDHFAAAARAAFASIEIGPVVSGQGERPGLRFGATDADGYLMAAGGRRRWFMADRVSQGVTVAQQIQATEADREVYPLCQWEVVGEERDEGVPRAVQITYRVVALTDVEEWIAPALVDAAAAASLRFVSAADLQAREPEVAAELGGGAEGAYQGLTAAAVDALILARIFEERRELLSFRSGPVVAQEGPVLGFWESVRSVSLWSDAT